MENRSIMELGAILSVLLTTAAQTPQDIPAGARSLDKSEISHLLIGRTMLGPAYPDGSPESTAFLADGSFTHGMSGVVYSVLRGKYSIEDGRVCEEAQGRQGCFYIAKSATKGLLLAYPPQGGTQTWRWLSIKVVRPSS